jgi:hypothetical protein
MLYQKLVVTIIAITCSAAFSAYPTTYPFENESYIPPPLVPSTPDYTFNPDTDPGGYAYRGVTLWVFDGVLTDDDFPYIPHNSGFSQYVLVNSYSAPPVLQSDVWNCSGKGIVFEKSDFLGVANNEEVCTPGSCCSDIIGLPKFGEDQHEQHDWFNGRAASGLCDVAPEEVYCIQVGGHFQVNCFSYWVHPTELPAPLICFDSFVVFHLNCNVFKTTYPMILPWDPPVYYDLMTMEETIVNDAAVFIPDRVCHPYSYYHPNTASTSGSSSASDSGSDESSSTVYVPLSIALLCLF